MADFVVSFGPVFVVAAADLQGAVDQACVQWGEQYSKQVPREAHVAQMVNHVHQLISIKQECRVCHCTQDRACPGGCGWTEVDLCSRCAAGTTQTTAEFRPSGFRNKHRFNPRGNV